MAQNNAVVTEDWRPSSEPIKDARLREDLAALLSRCAEHHDGEVGVPAEPTDVTSAEAAIGRETERLMTELRSSGSGAQGSSHAATIDLLFELRAADARVAAEREAGRITTFGRVREAMSLLRGVTTVEQMLERAPVAAARLGFDRTIVSAIKESYFVPRTCFMNGDTEWAQAVVRAGREQPRRLDQSLLETEMVRRRQPIRVLDAQNDPRVHREIAEVSMSRSYVAAPVIVQDKVIGFIHGDYFEQRRLVGAMDADALWMFSEAFGFAFERIAYGERVDRLRNTFLQTMAVAEENFAHACDDEISFDDQVGDALPTGPIMPRHPTPVASIGSGRSELGHLLTRRELEVLRLMAAGATNDGIASRLVISHGTAKTHVKHILRKLQASNRAEAVSRYFQLEHQGTIPDR